MKTLILAAAASLFLVPAAPKEDSPLKEFFFQIWKPTEGMELLGTPAPEWAAGKRWFNAKPLALKDLRGRVVLVRFWLIQCPLCSHSAPALNALHEKYAAKGLTVIGFHHPKSEEARDPQRVRRTAEAYGFRFPIALDDDWEALNKYWFAHGQQRRYTSVSFLIDKKGIIRWLHDGGEYFPALPADGDVWREDGVEAYRGLEAAVETLLAEDYGTEGTPAKSRR